MTARIVNDSHRARRVRALRETALEGRLMRAATGDQQCRRYDVSSLADVQQVLMEQAGTWEAYIPLKKDDLPCPVCGGDRLRPTFIGGKCHAQFRHAHSATVDGLTRCKLTIYPTLIMADGLTVTCPACKAAS